VKLPQTWRSLNHDGTGLGFPIILRWRREKHEGDGSSSTGGPVTFKEVDDPRVGPCDAMVRVRTTLRPLFEGKRVLLLHLDEIGREGWTGEELKIPKILIGPVDSGMFFSGRNK
jgi:hypothetical protein